MRHDIVGRGSHISNPFEDEELASRYEAWYASEGWRAELLEKELLQKLLDTFPDPRFALEIGCGTGHFTRWMSQVGLKAVGLDSSAAMLKEARRLGGPEYVRGDASSLPFVDRSFDVAALITALEFLPDPSRALAEAVRVSRRGVLLGVLNRWSMLTLRYRLSGDAMWRSARFFGPWELARGVRRACAGRFDTLTWRTTVWPVPGVRDYMLPWGSFIGMAVHLSDQ